MALNAPQFQVDIAQTAFGVIGKMMALVNATQMDNVHPKAILALEALGSRLTVDYHLMGNAAKILEPNSDYRKEFLKLHFGLSPWGVPSQVVKSPNATKSFLLISALGLTLDAELISEILFEIIGQTRITDQHTVYVEQLRDAVESLESHAKKLTGPGAMPDGTTEPLLNYLAEKRHSKNEFLFLRIPPNIMAKCIIAVFDAIQDAEVSQLEIRGCHGGLYLIATLWWLCRDQIQVSCDDGHILVSSPEPNPRISIVIQVSSEDSPPHLWSITTWTNVQSPDQVLTLDAEDSERYDIRAELPFIPKTQVYCQLLHVHLYPRETLNKVGILALALVQAACSYGQIAWANQFTKKEGRERFAFQNICPVSMTNDLKSCISVLGWPTENIDMAMVGRIAACFEERTHDLADASQSEVAGDLVKLLDRQGTGGLLLHDLKEDDMHRELRIRRMGKDAIEIAEYILLHATQRGNMEYPMGRWNSRNGQQAPTLIPALLGGKRSNSFSGLEYLRLALCSVHNLDFGRTTEPIIAVSERGYVAHLLAFSIVPQTPAEAFTIIVQPGRVKSESATQRIQILRDTLDFAQYTTDPKIATYQPVGPKGPPTLYLGPGALECSLSATPYSKSLQLRFHLAHSTDKWPKLTWAIVKWSLAYRPQASGKPNKELLSEDYSGLAEPLELRHPSYTGLHSSRSYPLQTTAIAGYYEDEHANFMRYGTEDASGLVCIDQGLASIYDCILYARAKVGKGWLIMARR